MHVDFSRLHGTKRTLTVTKWNPKPHERCTSPTCRHEFELHYDGVACGACTCDNFLVDTNRPPDEWVTAQEWHHAETDALISDPDEIAELERRLAALGGA